MLELDTLRAGGCCCDDNGSWDNCVRHIHTECEKYQVYMNIFGIDVPVGHKCDDMGAFCKEAPDGDAHAQCEGNWFNDTCSILEERGFCSYYKTGGCAQWEDNGSPPHWHCECTLDTTTEEENNSRKECTGDACWI